MFTELLALLGVLVGALLAGAGLLHLLPRVSKAAAGACCRAPGLDLVVTYFTIAPPVVGAIVHGWRGLLAGIAAQVAAVLIWTPLHELAHPAGRKGPRIVHTLNRLVGRWRNHTAVWITALAVPVFWIIRVAEWVVYPPLTVLVRFPKYNSGEWVNVSRQKFGGLVGHDLIWCLYCDWMTGVWSLGSEMLRNVESFWCPIRFRSDKKCENCRIDFPDLENGWAPALGTMGDVTAALDRHYRREDRVLPWFGHPARLTIEGREPSEPGKPEGSAS